MLDENQSNEVTPAEPIVQDESVPEISTDQELPSDAVVPQVSEPAPDEPAEVQVEPAVPTIDEAPVDVVQDAPVHSEPVDELPKEPDLAVSSNGETVPADDVFVGEAPVPDPNVAPVDNTSGDGEGTTTVPAVTEYTTPNGWVWNVSVKNGRYYAIRDDLSRQLFSEDPHEDIDSFYKYLNIQFPADVSDPFTGETLAARLNRGAEGPDWTKPADVKPLPNTPSVKVHLDYPAFINALSWFPQALANIYGKLVQDSEAKTVHVLVRVEDDFKAEWDHLLKKEEPATPEAQP